MNGCAFWSFNGAFIPGLKTEFDCAPLPISPLVSVHTTLFGSELRYLAASSSESIVHLIQLCPDVINTCL